jgi:hypothetical protein
MSRDNLKSGLERDPHRPGALPSNNSRGRHHDHHRHHGHHDRVSTGHHSTGGYASDEVATVEEGGDHYHGYHHDDRSEMSSDVGTDVEGHQEQYYQRSSANTRSGHTSRGNSNSTSRRTSNIHSRRATNSSQTTSNTNTSSSESPATGTDYSNSNTNTAATTPTSASESDADRDDGDDGDIENVNVVGEYTDGGLVQRANALMDELQRDTENYRAETKNIKKSLARMR